MEIKKSPKADLQRKRFLFGGIGLVVAGAAVGSLFFIPERSGGIFPEGTMEVLSDEEMLPELFLPEELLPEIPRTEAVPVVPDELEVVKNDAADTDLPFPERGGEPSQVQQEEVISESREQPVEEPFFADEQPRFMDGDGNAFYRYIRERVRYPRAAERNRIQGRVVVRFIIAATGEIRDIRVVEAPHELLANEVIRVIRTAPAWTPGKHRNEPVDVEGTLRMEFRL